MIAVWLDALLQFLRDHADWAAPIAFVIAFVKSLAFVSFVIPGITLMLAIGGLISAAGIGFTPVWIAISLGAALGDWVSYAVGFRARGRVHQLWPMSRHPDLLPRAERFFRRFGWLSVVLCRFFSPLRATVPLLCGVFEMPALTFQLANWSSAFLWSAAMLGPGAAVVRWLRGG
jgi:membrane protein DedA with SNARE-associated domain